MTIRHNGEMVLPISTKESQQNILFFSLKINPRGDEDVKNNVRNYFFGNRLEI
jgi:hypothetical protein